MRILSLDEGASLLGDEVRTFFEQGDWRYPDKVPNLRIPTDSGAKVVLARLLGAALREQGDVLLWITDTAVWPNAQHIDLCLRFRQSFGDRRAIFDAPLHLCGPSDAEALVSVLLLSLLFMWDLEATSLNHAVGLTISHDEWFEIRTGRGAAEGLADKLGVWLAPYEVPPGAGPAGPG